MTEPTLNLAALARAAEVSPTFARQYLSEVLPDLPHERRKTYRVPLSRFYKAVESLKALKARNTTMKTLTPGGSPEHMAKMREAKKAREALKPRTDLQVLEALAALLKATKDIHAHVVAILDVVTLTQQAQEPSGGRVDHESH